MFVEGRSPDSMIVSDWKAKILALYPDAECVDIRLPDGLIAPDNMTLGEVRASYEKYERIKSN